MSDHAETLLEASDVRRRLLQQGLALAGALALVSGVSTLALARGASRGAGALAVVAGVALILAASRVVVRFELDYHAHVIRFENSVVSGERLILDGRRITQGALGYRKTLEGTIQRGSKAGTRIRAESVAGLIRFRCRITSEPR